MSLRPYGSVAVFILAGGRGERLDLLTSLRAKPAVPFGGNSRIIDFVLSNCFHSGLSDVSILTQYLPRSLEDHVAFGRAWDLDRVTEGLSYLHPFRGHNRSNWYGGTANALYENLTVLEESRADHFLILGGDHIYRMDYRELVARHEASMAQVTVAVRRVPMAQAPQFGIFEQDASGAALAFTEKPAEPKSDLASMGLYVVRREFLLDELRRRGPDEPALDFGKDLVPDWVERHALSLFPYDGYWLDVGTLDSFFAAHMDLLGEKAEFRLDEPDWPIITRTPPRAPMHLDGVPRLKDSLISEGCKIHGEVERSILGPGVVVEAGAKLCDSIIMEDTHILAGSVVQRAIIDKRTVIGKNNRIGGEPGGLPNVERPDVLSSGLTLIAKECTVPDGFRIGRNVRWGLGPDDDPMSQFPDRSVPDGATVIGRS